MASDENIYDEIEIEDMTYDGTLQLLPLPVPVRRPLRDLAGRSEGPGDGHRSLPELQSADSRDL